LEYGVRSHHDHLRGMLPVYNAEDAPHEEDMSAVNTRMQDALQK
jgi:hypothetical protein